MGWRISQAQSRQRYLAKFDAAEAVSYDAMLGRPGRADVEAYLTDLTAALPLAPGVAVLDAGAGTGALTYMLSHVPGLELTALEPAPTMLQILRCKPELSAVSAVAGFCDHADDRRLFAAGQFDAIVSRQLVNGLYDPLAAFRNWHHWLKPGGAVAVIEGRYGRSDWTGPWAEEVDVLPLSATQSTATAAYLLEVAGLRIETVRALDAVNRLPATRTPRYLVVARRAG